MYVMGSGNSVNALNAETGKLLWSVPHPQGITNRGFNYWESDDRKDRRLLYTDSIVALEAATGKVLWHFQTVHHDLWDFDVVTAPQLITVNHEGRTIEAVAQPTKQGFLFVFDRLTGKPLWPIEERAVPKSLWTAQGFIDTHRPLCA